MAEDVLIWPFMQDGQYTCKMGYRFLKEEAELDYVQVDSGMDTNLWDLDSPNS